jgi:DNA-directed RNA polymerase specialized sigma subunit
MRHFSDDWKVLEKKQQPTFDEIARELDISKTRAYTIHKETEKKLQEHLPNYPL